MYLNKSTYHKSFPELWATIVSDGEDLSEYEMKIDISNRMAECYVESKEGSSVTIEWGNEAQATNFVVQTFIDGEDNGFERIRPLEQGHVYGLWISETHIKEWYFACIPPKSTTVTRRSRKRLDHIGTIEVRMFSAEDMNTMSPSAFDSDDYDDDAFLPVQYVPKASNKKGFHQIVLRDSDSAKVVPREKALDVWENMDSPEKPYATFRFHYRPKQILQEILPSGYAKKPSHESEFGGTGTLRSAIKLDETEINHIEQYHEPPRKKQREESRRYYETQKSLADYKAWLGNRKLKKPSLKELYLKLNATNARAAMLKSKIRDLKAAAVQKPSHQSVPVIDLTNDTDMDAL